MIRRIKVPFEEATSPSTKPSNSISLALNNAFCPQTVLKALHLILIHCSGQFASRRGIHPEGTTLDPTSLFVSLVLSVKGRARVPRLQSLFQPDPPFFPRTLGRISSGFLFLPRLSNLLSLRHPFLRRVPRDYHGST